MQRSAICARRAMRLCRYVRCPAGICRSTCIWLVGVPRQPRRGISAKMPLNTSPTCRSCGLVSPCRHKKSYMRTTEDAGGMELRYEAAAQNFADIRPCRADLLPYRQCRAYLRGRPLPTAIDKTAKNENAINKNSAEKNIRCRSLLGTFSAACRPLKQS